MKLKLGFLLIFGGYIYGDTSYQSCLDNSPQMGCIIEELDYQDGLLNRYYKQAMRRLDKSEQTRLRKAQRAWMKYRDSKCDAEANEMRGGSLEGILRQGCIVDMTTKRAEELRVY